MRMLAITITAALLGGCHATSAQQVRDEGVREQASSNQSPERAAGCMARNLESIWRIAPSVRTALQPGAWEVVMNIQAYEMYVGYAIAEPAPSGSTLTAWALPKSSGQANARKTLAGC